MMSPSVALGLIVLLIFAVLIAFFTVRAKRNGSPYLRPIPAFDALKAVAARMRNEGKRAHLALGTGRISDATTAETLAGVEVLTYLAGQAAAANTSPVVTTADPAATLLAQHTLRNAFSGDAAAMTAAAPDVRWIAPQPAAYAAGVMSVLSQEKLTDNALIGKFGDEFLLMGEAGYRQKTPMRTVAASADPNVLPFVYATSPHGLWGEEMFAAGAYLGNKPTHIGSLLAQDTLRWGISFVILGGVILKAFGVW